MAEYIPWWKKQADFREKKVVVKLYHEDGSFQTSIHIPSVYWPLNGSYEVFTWKNTCCIEDDPKAMAIFDSLEYKIGHCYQNTTQLLKAFQDAGYSIKPYCGWAFAYDQTPVHHCWAVLRDEENHAAVLDLSCDSYQMRLWFTEKEKDPAWCVEGQEKERIVEWIAYALTNFSNSKRCLPLGMVPPTHLFIGSECEPENGILLYNNLIKKYPNHECERSVNLEGYNKTQWLLKQSGLME